MGQRGEIKRRAFEMKVEAAKSDGTFEGYGAVFGNVDSYNDVIAPGAFLRTLAELEAAGRSLPILWDHGFSGGGQLPVGHWEALAEDETGLRGKGVLWIDESPTARVVLQALRTRSVSGLSIGFVTRKASRDEATLIRTLSDVDLHEISIVVSPANDLARVDPPKSAAGDLAVEIAAEIRAGRDPVRASVVRLLAEAGFKSSQAAEGAGLLMGMLRREEPDEDDDAALAAAARAARERIGDA